jgi:CBS domain containing-hemolysin-like protein
LWGIDTEAGELGSLAGFLSPELAAIPKVQASKRTQKYTQVISPVEKQKQKQVRVNSDDDDDDATPTILRERESERVLTVLLLGSCSHL